MLTVLIPAFCYTAEKLESGKTLQVREKAWENENLKIMATLNTSHCTKSILNDLNS